MLFECFTIGKHSLKLTMKPLYLKHCTLLSLLNAYVFNILDYGCEVWGYQKGSGIEKVHHEFLGYVLRVRIYTKTSQVYCSYWVGEGTIALFCT